MGNIIHAAERFRRDYRPQTRGEETDWFCIDDRYLIGKGLYRQVAGGAAGVGDAWAKAEAMRALRLRRSSDVVNLAERQGLATAPVQVLGSIAAKTLRAEGIKLGVHDNCAREASAKPIAEIEAKGGVELFRRSRTIKPDLDSATFEQIVHISRELLSADRIMSADEAAGQFDEGGVWGKSGSGLWQLDPVERVPLVESPHASPIMLADYGRNVAYDVKAAFTDEGSPLPAYHISLGDIPDEIAGPLSDVIPFDTDDFMAAVAVNHAATSIALDPHAPAGHDQIDIYRIAS